MEQFRLRVKVLDRKGGSARGRSSDRAGDEHEVEHLVGVVREALGRSRAGAAAVVVREQRTELVDLAGVRDRRVRMHHWLAGLTRSTAEGYGAPLAVGLAGRFVLRRRGAPDQPVGLVFLEWPDCRWSLWQVMLDGGGFEVPDSEVRRCAADGDPLPGGLGRWWTLGRRLRMMVRFGPPETPTVSESPLVH